MRVFIGPVEVAGIAKGLSIALKKVGVNAQVILSIRNSFCYGGENNFFLLKIWQALGQLRTVSDFSILLKILAVGVHRAWGFIIFFWAILYFDAFIFLFGKTITDTKIELIILRFFHKKIIFINVGTDIRPPYMNGKFSSRIETETDLVRLARLTARIKRRALLHEKFANFIVAQPTNAQFYEKKIINYFSLGVPISFDLKQLRNMPENNILEILHFPSDPVIKGTEVICTLINQLIDEGLPLKLVCLQGVSNSEVLKCLERCDFVVDQLYSDIPMAVTGLEAAIFAKPCIVAGYLTDNNQCYISENDLPPSLYVSPDGLRGAIEKLAYDKNFRKNLGERAHEFVTERWSSEAVGERYLMLLEGRFHPDWLFDPSTITYTGGCGMPLNKIAKVVAMLIDKYGQTALQVGDKSNLEQALVNLANQFHEKGVSA